mgnify:CR=1 FL=1
MYLLQLSKYRKERLKNEKAVKDEGKEEEKESINRCGKDDRKR